MEDSERDFLSAKGQFHQLSKWTFAAQNGVVKLQSVATALSDFGLSRLQTIELLRSTYRIAGVFPYITGNVRVFDLCILHN